MIFLDLKGTTNTYIQIQKGGPRLANLAGEINVRNAAGGADANLICAMLKNSGNSFEINSDGTGVGADQIMTVARPVAGMAGAVTFTLPAISLIMPTADGAAGTYLQTDGAGNLSFAAASVSNALTVDSTAITAASVSPVAMFTLPATAIIDEVKVIIDLTFDAAATLDVGIAGTINKYMDNAEVDLTSSAKSAWAAYHNEQAPVAPEAIIATLVTAAANGNARILTKWTIPS